MRLEAKIKKGFYPLPESAIPLIAERLKCGPNATIFDPVAGEGVALDLLATELDIPRSNVYASELDVSRAEAARVRLEGGSVFGPLDFLGSHSYGGASIIYCNPPFDDELGGGGRIEWKFIDRAIGCLMTSGVFVLVIPESTFRDYRTMEILTTRLETMSAFPLPEEIRRFREVVVFGRKRKKLSEWENIYVTSLYTKMLRYEVPDGGAVMVRKTEYTDAEVLRLVHTSEANAILSSSDHRLTRRNISPPMELRRGHVAMLLAGGFLDGVVDDGVNPPHVVRGTARKITTAKTEDEGNGVKKVIETQRIVLSVKVATESGEVIKLEEGLLESEEEVIENPEEERDDAEQLKNLQR